jgi:integrase/recombinase XerC
MSLFRESFLRFLQFEKRYSAHTVQAYLADITAFEEYCATTFEILDIADLRHIHIRSWMVSLLETGMVTRSVNRKLSSLRAYFRFLRKREAYATNPMTKVQAPKTRTKLPQVVDEKTLQLLRQLLAEGGEDFPAMRDRAIIELLYGLGLRRAELIAIQIPHIDLKARQVRILGKRQKERIVPFGAGLGEFLDTYIRVRNHHPAIQSDSLILTDKGRTPSPRMIYDAVYGLLSLVTTIQKRSPHVLRHSYATHMLEAGANIEAIRELLGHSSLAATQVYTQTSMERLKKSYRQAHPKA